jgi:peptidoglycan/LPS O-acetylase OafA/YrhL
MSERSLNSGVAEAVCPNVDQTTSREASGHIASLDGLRGMAILMVLFHHAWPYVWDHPAYWVLTTLKHVGWIGVDLFFVLSGFLITGILLDTRGQRHAFRNFVARRSLRVFPLYYFVLLLSFTLIPAGLAWLRSDPTAEATASVSPTWFAFYAANYIPFLTDPLVSNQLHDLGMSGAPESLPDFLAVTWSLCVEEQFYLVWPLLILFARAVSLRTIVGLLAAAIAVRFAVVFTLDHWQSITYMSTFCRGDSLLIGASLAAIIRCDAVRMDRCTLLARLAAFVLLPLTVLWIIKSGGRGDPYFAAFGYTFVATGFGGLLLVALSSKSRLMTRPLENRWLRAFGKYSYGLYLYHMIVIAALEAWRPATMLPSGGVADPNDFAPFGGSILIDAPVRTILVISLSMVIAWISYRWLESPFLQLKRYFVSKPDLTGLGERERRSSNATTKPSLGSL